MNKEMKKLERKRIAIEAMKSLIINEREGIDDIVRLSYRYADKMIEASEKT